MDEKTIAAMLAETQQPQQKRSPLADFLVSEKDQRPYWETQHRGMVMPLVQSGYNNSVSYGVPGVLGGQGWQTMNDIISGRSVTPDEIGHAAGDVAGAAMTGAFAAPKPTNAVGMFGGRLAKTADHQALAKAEQLDASGTPREQIWNDTGWFKGVDGKWRFEISDDKARWNLMRAIEQENGTVGEFMTHGKLMDAYPDLAAAKATTNGFGAAYFPRTDTVQIGGELPLGQFPTSAALHELQHAVQSREGFAKGGSSLDGDIYNQISGEAEARLVQKRQKMTADERQSRAPWLDYDVPEAQQIVHSNPKQSSAAASIDHLRKSRKGLPLFQLGVPMQGGGLSSPEDERQAMANYLMSGM